MFAGKNYFTNKTSSTKYARSRQFLTARFLSEDLHSSLERCVMPVREIVVM